MPFLIANKVNLHCAKKDNVNLCLYAPYLYLTYKQIKIHIISTFFDGNYAKKQMVAYHLITLEYSIISHQIHSFDILTAEFIEMITSDFVTIWTIWVREKILMTCKFLQI